jgi:hypothetical protein
LPEVGPSSALRQASSNFSFTTAISSGDVAGNVLDVETHDRLRLEACGARAIFGLNLGRRTALSGASATDHQQVDDKLAGLALLVESPVGRESPIAVGGEGEDIRVHVRGVGPKPVEVQIQQAFLMSSVEKQGRSGIDAEAMEVIRSTVRRVHQ